VPGTAEVPEAERLEEWGLSGAAAEAVRSFVAHGLLPQTRDRLGSLILRFPRLAVDWAYFENEEAGGTLPSTTWYYRSDGSQEQGLSTRDVADRVERKPEGTHRVWSKGLENWRDPREVPEIARLLSAPGGPPKAPLRPAEEEPAPPQLPAPPPHDDEEVPPPLPGGEDPGPLFHYACDTETVGKLPAGEIARRVAASPDRIHRVWTKSFGTNWKTALDVPEIASRLPDLPPALP
jgi:hypothetical protein